MSQTEESTEATDVGMSAASEDAEGSSNVNNRTEGTQEMKMGQSRVDAIAVRRELEGWPRKNRGVVRVIRGPGCCRPCTSMKKWFRPEWGKVMWGLDRELCGAATIVYAVDDSCRRMTALCYMRSMKKTRSAVSTLAGMTKLVHQMRS